MARIRTVKPEFFLDEDLAELPYVVRLFYVGLWCLADREGRMEDRPRFIKTQIFPYDDENPESLLETLAAPKKTRPEPFILRYEVDGRKYIQILRFSEHQRPHHTEHPSVIPPPKGGALTVSTPSTDVKVPTGREGKGRERKGKDDEPTTPPEAAEEYIARIKKYHNELPESFRAEWEEIYGGTINVDACLFAATTWLIENPDRRKKNIKKFYGNWLRNQYARATQPRGV